MSVNADVDPALLPEGRLLYQIDFPIRWGDMDALGHVNNTVYFRYFEQIRLEWYLQSGFAPLDSGREGILIVDNHAEYLKPVVYPMHVTIRMGGHSPGRSSFTSTYTLSVDDVLYTRGSSRIVWVDTRAGKSVAMPETVRAMLTQSGEQTGE
ncbi:acyl-CoA thioesterase [Granulosicoccus sp. 3-233]|uniref:acyl-CoA thioesterase n=1 Tax=Granulosicoccus sp. 3-233 TaxID=3417969 RepID=UPI003D333C6C